MKKKYRRKTIIGAVVLTLLLSRPVVFASGIDTTVIDEKWGKPTFVYGEGLTESEIIETQKVLGIEDIKNVYSMPATNADLRKYLGDGADDQSAMISSVIVQKQEKGKGVDVTIKTPEFITQITKEQYENASITAGVTDAKIIVGSVKKVTGESALTGIYKAFDANGELLEADRMEVAQEELITVNAIAQENKAEENFNTEKLDQVIIEVKQKLSELKDQQSELATREDIERIINDALAKYNLQNIVTQDQIDRLVALFDKYQNTSAIDSEAVKTQLKDLSREVGNKLKDIVQEAQASGLLDRIIAFFRDIFNAIFSMTSQ